MTTNDQDRLIPLELTLGTLTWLRAYLKDARTDAEDDHQEVERLHSDVAIRAAKVALNQELDSMTKVIEALDVAIATDDAREAIAKKLAAMTPPVA